MNTAVEDTIFLAPCALTEERRGRSGGAADWPAAVAALDWAALGVGVFAFATAGVAVLLG